MLTARKYVLNLHRGFQNYRRASGFTLEDDFEDLVPS